MHHLPVFHFFSDQHNYLDVWHFRNICAEEHKLAVRDIRFGIEQGSNVGAWPKCGWCWDDREEFELRCLARNIYYLFVWVYECVDYELGLADFLKA